MTWLCPMLLSTLRPRHNYTPHQVLCSFHAFPSKCPEPLKFDQFHKVKILLKTRKFNRPSSKSNQFWRWSGYISMPNFRLFLLCVLQKMPHKSKILTCFTVSNCAKMRTSNCYQNSIISYGGKDTLACQISGHSFQEFSSLCQKLNQSSSEGLSHGWSPE